MIQDISNPLFWRRRLEAAKREPHRSVFHCTLERWQTIEARHREILAATIGPEDSVLDAGCGWGRLLELMPAGWIGEYLGVDLSPDFIDLAKRRSPHRQFCVGDLRDLSTSGNGWDWAILISIRGMVRRNLGEEAWTQMEAELRRVAKRLLLLEYDPNGQGSIE